MKSARLRHGRALLLYLLLAITLTWPLAARFATHVTGDGIDDPALAWNLWWLKARLVDQLQPDIFHVDWMFHPVDINLAFYTLTPLNGLLSIPLQTAASVIIANNVLLLLSFVLGGYGAYLLAQDLLGRYLQRGSGASGENGFREAAALFAGLVFAFASSKLFYASLGQFNIASSYWIPFCALYILRTGRVSAAGAGWRSAAMAGLFLVFQSWAELTYASFLLIFIALYVLWRLLLGVPPGARRLHDAWRILSRFALTGAIFVLGIAPILAAMLADLRREGDFFASGGGFADLFSADLMGYLVPTRLHPLVGAWTAALPFPNDKGQHIYIGYVVLALAVVGFVALLDSERRAVRRLGVFWGAALAIFWLLTLGPELRWAGEGLGIPGPFALVSRLPFFSGNRYPSRYSVMLMLCAGMLAAVGLLWLLQRLRRPRAGVALALVLAVLTLFEHLSAPLPLSDFRVPPIFAAVSSNSPTAATTGTLLELPTGWRNGARVLGKSDVVIMLQQWYQTEHGLRRLGGNTSRNPAYKFQYFSEAPLLGDLIALMNADDSTPATQHIAAEVARQFDTIVERNRAIAPGVLDFLGVEQALVYVDHASPWLLRFVEEALPLTLEEEWQGPDWQGRPSTLRLYRVDARPAAGVWSVDLAGDLGKLHLAEGWSALATEPGGVRYALRPAVDLLLDVPTSGGSLTIELYGPAEEVVLALNGRNLGTFAIADDGPSAATVLIPAGAGDRLVDRLTLRFAGPGLPPPALADPPAAGWPVGESGTVLARDAAVVVRSAGADVGAFAEIRVNGRNIPAEQQNEQARGYHLVALQDNGQILDYGQFDTFGDPTASAAMAAWLDQWPDGTIIAGAVADEASRLLDEAAVAALGRIGVADDLRGRFRWSHAFIGVAGAAPGSVPAAMQLLQPAGVSVGASATGPAAYGGVGRIEFAPFE